MFAFMFFFILSSVTAPDPANIKPGALVGHVGRVSLVEALQTILSQLERVLEQMDSVLSQLEDEMHKFQGKLSDQTLVTLLHARLSY